MNIQRLAAFADGHSGGNPAGICLVDELPGTETMQSVAADVGYSETAFASPFNDGWRVRYFSPESEVPFCGHATIALGAALTKARSAGIHHLHLNNTRITVEGMVSDDGISAALQSPETQSSQADDDLVQTTLQLFGYSQNDLDQNLPPARIFGGADHLLVGLNTRAALKAMHYQMDIGRTFMRDAGLVTVMFVYAESNQYFHSRNPFASGGVYEDPATGAASAAFAGYLRDLDWPHGGDINIVQGEDMGSRSLIRAQFSNLSGTSIRITGAVREIQ